MLSCGSDDDANGGGHATGGPDYYSEHLRSTVLELQGRHIQEQDLVIESLRTANEELKQSTNEYLSSLRDAANTIECLTAENASLADQVKRAEARTAERCRDVETQWEKRMHECALELQAVTKAEAELDAQLREMKAKRTKASAEWEASLAEKTEVIGEQQVAIEELCSLLMAERAHVADLERDLQHQKQQVDLAMSQVAASGEMEQQQLAAYEHDASESSERRLREHFESTVSAIRLDAYTRDCLKLQQLGSICDQISAIVDGSAKVIAWACSAAVAEMRRNQQAKPTSASLHTQGRRLGTWRLGSCVVGVRRDAVLGVAMVFASLAAALLLATCPTAPYPHPT